MENNKPTSDDPGYTPDYNHEDEPSVVREPIRAYGRKKLSIAEYLEWESSQSEKHEYYQGEIFEMCGPKLPHVRITTNLTFELTLRLKGKGCEVFATDLRLHIPQNTLFT